MPAPHQPFYDSDLQQLITQALLNNDTQAIERYLTEHNALLSPHMNTELINTFANIIGHIVTQPTMPPVERIEALLDDWAGLTLASSPVNDPREILPATAALTYGQVAIVRPDWWDDEVAKLHKAASHARWRVREMVAAALQRMLAADSARTHQLLINWQADEDPLVVKTSATALQLPSIE